ncbi:fimbria/pilus periplasmic chaperone [Escherichia ruysiae]|uniref:fimbria/pilus chaperone family protein n=1 Tax=Escherichia TaxID=561 RepID=UPI000CF75985|nr:MULTISPECIES: fimbria/pilus chaperone family protein [Escherichia]MBS5154502.1 fimbria/pilus periplasmic chaperone [Escherichia coli]MBY7187217.1 fimbria/pilus periplasmic chaperone [Escherichia ruysiae]MBY7307815.1 fimbria/pilus periplasmic chaperone [Escherichia ruysiae]MBY7367022.1 fimbria/pilus periplasmic chaperone [Escherichia coli]
MKNITYILFFLFLGVFRVHGAGMQPETPLLLVSESDGEASITITNTDDKAALLYVRTENIAEDRDSGIKLIPTQPVTRVEAGKTQKVRFILQTKVPLTKEHMMRAKFSGVPTEAPVDTTKSQVKVDLIFTQDIPVLIQPKGQVENQETWKFLEAKQQGALLTIHNPSSYVVRLSPELKLPSGNVVTVLPQAYILPQTSVSGKLTNSNTVEQLVLQPLSSYGFKLKPQPLNVSH